MSDRDLLFRQNATMIERMQEKALTPKEFKDDAPLETCEECDHIPDNGRLYRYETIWLCRDCLLDYFESKEVIH